MMLIRSHAFVMVSVFQGCKCNQKKKKKKASDLIGIARAHALKSWKCNFLAFSYWNIHWCSKDHMAESKYSEKPPLVLTNLIQTVMWPIRYQKIWSTEVQFFPANTMFQRQYEPLPKWQNFFKCFYMFFQVCIFDIKSNFHMISCQNGNKN